MAAAAAAALQRNVRLIISWAVLTLAAVEEHTHTHTGGRARVNVRARREGTDQTKTTLRTKARDARAKQPMAARSKPN